MTNYSHLRYLRFLVEANRRFYPSLAVRLLPHLTPLILHPPVLSIIHPYNPQRDYSWSTWTLSISSPVLLHLISKSFIVNAAIKSFTLTSNQTFLLDLYSLFTFNNSPCVHGLPPHPLLHPSQPIMSRSLSRLLAERVSRALYLSIHLERPADDVI